VTIEITVDQVILIHSELGAGLLGDRGKLEGAVAAPFATWDGNDLHPSLAEKAAKLIEAIITAHAFDDGNKRVAWLACVGFLELNEQVLIDIPAKEVDGRIRDLEAHHIPRQVFALWISDQLLAD